MYFLKLLFSSIGAVFKAIGNATRSIWEPVWQGMAAMFKFQQDEVKRPLIVLISILVIVGSLVSIFLSQRRRSVKINLKPFEHLGVVMGEKVIALDDNNGPVVLWRMKSQVKIPVVDVPIKYFKDALDKKGLELIMEENVINAGQPPLMVPDMMMGGMAGDKFLALLNKYPNAGVLVLFGNTPYLTDEQLRSLPQHRPKVFVVAMHDLPRKSLFENGIIQAAIVPRFQQPPAGGNTNEPQTSTDWFDRYYMVVDPQTASTLPW